jgi:hypothetical protein
MKWSETVASKCLICGTNEDAECTLIPIDGTQEGMNVRCEIVHIRCLDLWFSIEQGLIYHCLVNCD